MFALSLLALLCIAHQANGENDPASLGVSFTKRQNGLPILTLPYGQYQASSYDWDKDIYKFSNIRFAAPPTGNLRWAKPAPPKYNATLQDGSYGNACVQTVPNGLNLIGPLNQLGPLAAKINKWLDGIIPLNPDMGDEDCLFLDMQVPGSAIRSPSTSRLGVVVWIYGGAYVLGQKNQGESGISPLYDGTGPITTSNNNLIFVEGNYRLATYGFLAGTTVEQEGLPNAGFYDQVAVFEWVQKYIHLVGGDKSQVTAWGESAGAGSILHHLTAFGGKRDPLFRKAVMQSIASELMIDRRGDLEAGFQSFAKLAGCQGQGLACLRAANASVLRTANQEIVRTPPSGAFGPGPAADGAFVRQMPALELASGNYWKDMDGLILSHVLNEPTLFVTGKIATNAQFNNLVDFIIPAYAPEIRKNMETYYPPPGIGKQFSTQTSRVEAYLSDTNFLCNYRYLSKAYKGKTYNMQYSVAPGYHGGDLLPTFFDATIKLFPNITIPLVPGFGSLAIAYQNYLTSFTLTGNPNTYSVPASLQSTIPWPLVSGVDEEMLSNVLNTTESGFELITDTESLLSHCEHFLNVQAAITTQGGYSPPGAVVKNNLGAPVKNPSRNYKTP